MKSTRSRHSLTGAIFTRWRALRPRLALLALVLLLPVLSVGCGSTEITHSWKSPTFNTGPFHRVLVIGLAARPEVRRIYEDAFVAQLQNQGRAGAVSYTLLPDVQKGDATAVAQAAKQCGADCVLVTHVVKSVVEDTVSTPSAGVQAQIDTAWPGTYTPVVTGQSDVVTLESRLYGVSPTQLVWTGTTKTFDAQKLEQSILDFSKIIVKELVKQKLL